jgi:glycosyltransferase involved in cell wall biosynthesis
MTDLSVLIPARNEQFLSRTIQDILENMRGDTEIIAVLDGAWADPPILDNPAVTIIYHPESIGQRAATNEAARLANGKYIMKCDAHCAFAPGFDLALMADCEPNWTVIPRMYNLHAFDWVCECGQRIYQGPRRCAECGSEDVKMEIVWKPRKNRRTDFARFDRDLHFQYWRDYELRDEAQGDIADVMCCVGACWMMHRERYWDIGGMDENHGGWGQMGVELACKSWLSGGRQVVNKKTWFAHLFRTQPGFGFPYAISGSDQERAREYSRRLWNDNTWVKSVYPLQWLIDKFAPIPGWHD